MPAKKISGFTKINLVPKDPFDETVVGKIMKWALTAGKSIVILTEFVVILAFLSRFKLDRDLNDLNEITSQKANLAASFAPIEEKMNKLQKKIVVLEGNKKNNILVSEQINELKSLTPFDVEYESVSFKADALELVGEAGSELGFATLLNGMNNNPSWDRVSLGQTQFSQSKGGVLFLMEMNKVAEKETKKKGVKNGD